MAKLSARQNKINNATRNLRKWWRLGMLSEGQKEKLIAIGFKPESGRRSFAEAYPDLLEAWHPDKNGELDPGTLPSRSGKKVWFRCYRCGTAYSLQPCELGVKIDKGSARDYTRCKKCRRLAAEYPKSKPTLCVETGELFKSVRSAAGWAIGSNDRKKRGSAGGAIQRAITKGYSAYGYHWRYATEEEIAAPMVEEGSDGG